MKLEIRGRDVEITETIRGYIERRLGFALDRFAERIRIARLKIRDVNSCRGGVDKYCRLAVSFAHASTIAVESRDVTVHGAIDHISSKVGDLLARRFKRTRERRRSGTPLRQVFDSPSFSMRTFLPGEEAS